MNQWAVPDDLAVLVAAAVGRAEQLRAELQRIDSAISREVAAAALAAGVTVPERYTISLEPGGVTVLRWDEGRPSDGDSAPVATGSDAHSRRRRR